MEAHFLGEAVSPNEQSTGWGSSSGSGLLGEL